MLRILCVALLACAATPAAALDYHRGDKITGPLTQIIDGDTLRFRQGDATVNVRLHGIDAPEYNQMCRDAAGVPYSCGQAATEHMAKLVGASTEPCPSARMHGLCVRASHPITCTVTDMDRRYGRVVAVCTSGGTDINWGMVAAGWARAYTAFSRDYVSIEGIARGQRRGQWAGTADDPATVRHAGH